MTEEEKNNKKIKNNFLKKTILALFLVFFLFLAFAIGVFVGEKKAKFSYRWAEEYHKMFAGPKTGFFNKGWHLPREEYIEGYGNFGEIIKIKENEFVIKGKGEIEKVIFLTEKTVVQKGRNRLEKKDLKIGDFVVVIGSPNEEGKIEAKIIRIFDKDLRKSPMPFKKRMVPFL